MMTNDNVLILFEGLTIDEARQFRRAIIPVLQKIRTEIIETRQQVKSKNTSKGETCRGNQDAMQSEIKKR